MGFFFLLEDRSPESGIRQEPWWILEERVFASKVVSFTPGFSPVPKEHQRKTVSTVFPLSLWKPLKRFLNNVSAFPPG